MVKLAPVDFETSDPAELRAAIKLQKHDPAAAIDLLRETVQYDLAFTLSFDYLYPAYIRGLAYEAKGVYDKARADFQQVLSITQDTDLRQQAQDHLKAVEGK